MAKEKNARIANHYIEMTKIKTTTAKLTCDALHLHTYHSNIVRIERYYHWNELVSTIVVQHRFHRYRSHGNCLAVMEHLIFVVDWLLLLLQNAVYCVGLVFELARVWVFFSFMLQLNGCFVLKSRKSNFPPWIVHIVNVVIVVVVVHSKSSTMEDIVVEKFAVEKRVRCLASDIRGWICRSRWRKADR